MFPGLFIEAQGERKPRHAGAAPALRWSRRLLVAGFCAGVLLVSGCGQKGDLYLPDKPDRQQQH